VVDADIERIAGKGSAKNWKTSMHLADVTNDKGKPMSLKEFLAGQSKPDQHPAVVAAAAEGASDEEEEEPAAAAAAGKMSTGKGKRTPGRAASGVAIEAKRKSSPGPPEFPGRTKRARKEEQEVVAGLLDMRSKATKGGEELDVAEMVTLVARNEPIIKALGEKVRKGLAVAGKEYSDGDFMSLFLSSMDLTTEYTDFPSVATLTMAMLARS
jgi:hypothetical protein